MAVGVPGELRGLKKAHEDYGKLDWNILIQPSIDLAESGININKHMYTNMISQEARIRNDPGLRSVIFFSNDTTKNRAHRHDLLMKFDKDFRPFRHFRHLSRQSHDVEATSC